MNDLKVGKRIAIVLLVVLVSGLAVIGYFLHQSRKNLSIDPYKAISPDACMVIETIDLQRFLNSMTTGKGLFLEIGKVSEFNNFNTKLKYCTDRINKPEFKKLIHGGISLIAFYPGGNGKMVPFLSMAIPAGLGIRQIKEALVTSGVNEISELKINGKRVLAIPFTEDNKKDSVFLSARNGLFLCTTSESRIEKILSSDTPVADIRNTPGFSRLLLSSGKNEDKIFFIFNNLSKFAVSLFSPDAKSVIESVSSLGGSYGGDLFLNDDRIAISGYLETAGSSESFNRYIPVQPGEFKTNKILPSATALFESFVITKELFKRNPGFSVLPETENMANRIKPFIGNEITKAFIDIKDNPASGNSIFICELNNRVECEKVFLENAKKKSDIKYFQPDDQTRKPVYINKERGLLSAIMPGLGTSINDSCYTFYDNFMVIGNSFQTLSSFLYDNMLNKTLANDERYSDFEKSLPSRSVYLMYCVPANALDYLEKFLSREVVSGLRSNMNSLFKIQSVGFQAAPINGMIYNSISIKYNDEIREESKAEWATLLDTTASIKPFFFTNHNTGAKEIFVQDLKNNVYLINAAGRVLWKVPVNERINGQVYMIDYYKNSKFQLLFSGENSLHVLDRNGNYVERYPVKLRSPAANPLALFDYDNNRDYRLIIAGKDKMVYAYDKSGKVVKGWKSFRTAGTVTARADFFKVLGKDYIVVTDESSVYFLDRSGNIRLNPKEPVTRAQGSNLRLVPGSEPSLICSSPDGTVQNIFFNGEVKKISFKTFSADHSFDFFDVDGDSFGEYVFIDKGVLYLYDHNREEMCTRDFNSDKLGGPINFVFSSSDRKIGVFDANKNLIYLLNKKGEEMNGFPLRGASMFSIGKMSVKNEWHLIVGGTDRFLYNYKIDIQ